MTQDRILVGGGGENYAEPRELLLHYANRHGLITGATGTGKTVTLQILAEGLSAAGVPVVIQDVKGDISGLSRARRPRRQGQRRPDRPRRPDRLHRLRLPRLPGGLLGPLRPDRPPGPHDGQRDGPAASRPDDGALRGPGGRPQHRLPRRRRAGPRAARPRRPPGDADLGRRQRQGPRPAPTATSPPPRSAPSSARSSSSRTRAPPAFSASPPSTSPTSSPPTPTAWAASTSSCPTS